MTPPTCPRCGDAVPCAEVTMFGDAEPRYVAIGACPCPQPCCPFCGGAIDGDGNCQTALCFLDGLPVPIPEMATPRRQPPPDPGRWVTR